MRKSNSRGILFYKKKFLWSSVSKIFELFEFWGVFVEKNIFDFLSLVLVQGAQNKVFGTFRCSEIPTVPEIWVIFHFQRKPIDDPFKK